MPLLVTGISEWLGRNERTNTDAYLSTPRMWFGCVSLKTDGVSAKTCSPTITENMHVVSGVTESTFPFRLCIAPEIHVSRSPCRIFL